MYRMRRATRSALILLLALPALAAGQDLPGLPVGTRVRVSARGIPDNTTATVVSISADTLHLVAGRTRYPVALPLRSLQQLDMSLGPGPRWPGMAKGAGIGALVGGAGGFALVTLLQAIVPDCLVFCGFEQSAEDRQRQAREDARLVRKGAAIGAAAGAVYGAVRGANRRGDRWQRVSLPLHVAVEPRGSRGLAFTLSSTF